MRARGLDAVDLAIGCKRPRGVLALRRGLATNHADVVNTHSSIDSWLTALVCTSLARAPAIVRTRGRAPGAGAAMMCGLACVTTNVGAIGEAALDGETALAQAIGRLAADPALPARHFGYEAMLDRMEAVFRDAVAA